MPEQGQQFNCPQCGKPQFTADFGFERHNHAPNHVEDPCIFCGESTAPGGMNMVDPEDPASVKHFVNNLPLMNPKFINRIDGTFDPQGKGEEIEGYACSDCMRVDCAKCGKLIPFGEDHVTNSEDGFYHEECINPKDHADFCCDHED